LFVCENNQFATEVPFQYSAGNPTVASRAQAYGLPGYQIADGNDVEAVFKIAGEAIHRARTGGGATLLECKTYRTRPHAEGMGDFGYRSREEVEAWKTRCPIRRFRERLVRADERGFPADKATLDGIDSEIARLVAEAHTVAESSPWPDPNTATRHV